MESYVIAMFLLLFVFLTVQYLSVIMYFFIPRTSLWQPISDVYIQEGNQSFWCSSHFHSILYNETEHYKFGHAVGCLIQVYGYGVCLIFIVSALVSGDARDDKGNPPPVLMVRCYSVLPWLFSAGVALTAPLVAYSEALPVSISTCSPIEEDALLVTVWSNWEWNSTDAWLQFANVTSLSAAEGIRSWFVGVNIGCCVAFAFLIILIPFFYDPEEMEPRPPKGKPVRNDTH